MTFPEQTEKFFRSAGPVRFGVRYRWENSMPWVWFHEAKNYAKGTGPFQTQEEAETLAKLLIMSKNHEGKRETARGNKRAASAAWAFQFDTAPYHVPAIPQSLDDERQIAIDERQFPIQSAA